MRSYHVRNGIPHAAFDDPRIDLLIKGAKRQYGEGKRRLRLPLTDDILVKLLPFIPDSHDGINLKAAICVGFAAFLRAGEFTWDSWDPSRSGKKLSRRHLHLHPSSLTLTLPSSKTDPFASGVDIHLAKAPLSPLCPVSAIRNLLIRYPAGPDAPAFSRMFGSFSKQYFVDKLHELLLKAGTSTKGFSGHSLRKGAAVSAKGKGISRDDIKTLGRWKSDAVDVYINEVPQTILTANLLALNSRLLSVSQGPSSPASRSAPSSPARHPIPSSTSQSLPSMPARRLARRD